MSQFNADAFLQQTVTEKMADKRVPVPEGEHLCQIRELSFKDGSTQEGKPWVQLTMKAAVLDPNVAQEMGVDEAFLYHRIFLDVTEDQQLATGTNKNVELGKLRTAAGQNGDGEWSLGELQGAEVGFVVEHKMNDSGDPSAQVRGFFGEDV